MSHNYSASGHSIKWTKSSITAVQIEFLLDMLVISTIILFILFIIILYDIFPMHMIDRLLSYDRAINSVTDLVMLKIENF